MKFSGKSLRGSTRKNFDICRVIIHRIYQMKPRQDWCADTIASFEKNISSSWTATEAQVEALANIERACEENVQCDRTKTGHYKECR